MVGVPEISSLTPVVQGRWYTAIWCPKRRSWMGNLWLFDVPMGTVFYIPWLKCCGSNVCPPNGCSARDGCYRTRKITKQSIGQVQRTIECSVARARQEAEAERESLQKQQRSKVRLYPVLPAEDTCIQPEVWNMGDELKGSMFVGGRERPLLSRSQK